MFFVKAAFWLTLVVAFIPVRSADLPEGERAVSTAETVTFARSVVDDVMTFCKRNEETCETGSLLISQMGAKAREGARITYAWLDKRYGKQALTAESEAEAGETGVDGIETGSLD